MSDTNTSSEHGRYVAEYVDGPLEGSAEHRYLQGGAPEQRLTQVALVDGTEALFEYVAGEARELNGEQYVRFTLDVEHSDPLQGAADPNQESKAL